MPKDSGTKVVTRFAPSPTGYLHIGGARTALFNWAYARRHGGTFILRVEDTDVARSTSRSSWQIVQDMLWLGLDWDKGPLSHPSNPDADEFVSSQPPENQRYFQSRRGDLYIEYLERLRKGGHVYRCFKTPEQLKAEREAARAAKSPEKYDPTESLSRSEADQQRLIDAKKPFVWRFRMPEADVTVNDLVLGDVTIKREELEDFVIMRSSVDGQPGLPMFHFANVVDDADMSVTHVLRAQEHLMNTPKHVAMFDALGIARPAYAHMPLIFNPDGTKMSKRDKAKTARAAAQDWIKKNGGKAEALLAKIVNHNEVRKSTLAGLGMTQPALDLFLAKKSDDANLAGFIAGALGIALPEIDVKDFRDNGYLKDVLLNYVSLLGWSPKGDVERFDLDFLRDNFDFSGIGKSNAKFDRAKLLAFNGDRIAKMPREEFEKHLADRLNAPGTEHVNLRAKLGQDPAKISLLAAAYQLRAKTLNDPLKAAAFLGEPDDAIKAKDEKTRKVLVDNDGAALQMLTRLAECLKAVEPWDPPSIHTAMEKFAAELGKPIGEIAQPLRVAITGTTVSPPIDLTLALLGKESTLTRIRHAG
ncbi:MAG: glutamate--tRNA ligase [Planctomycetota bacterium]|nr:glutamate--tRNA ligase [Planctomycetota bacterium]